MYILKYLLENQLVFGLHFVTNYAPGFECIYTLKFMSVHKCPNGDLFIIWEGNEEPELVIVYVLKHFIHTTKLRQNNCYVGFFLPDDAKVMCKTKVFDTPGCSYRLIARSGLCNLIIRCFVLSEYDAICPSFVPLMNGMRVPVDHMGKDMCLHSQQYLATVWCVYTQP